MKKQPSFPSRSSQRGMLIPILLAALVLMGIVVALYTQSDKGTNDTSVKDKARADATLIVKQGADLKEGSMHLAQDFDLSTMIFAAADGAGTHALFDPAKGIMSAPVPPTRALVSGSGSFAYDQTLVITGMGSGAANFSAVLAGVTQAVCQQINHIVWNDASNATVPTTLTRDEGCYSPGAGTYNYYKVIQLN